jgi:hypothetical protein
MLSKLLEITKDIVLNFFSPILGSIIVYGSIVGMVYSWGVTSSSKNLMLLLKSEPSKCPSDFFR